jgi:hypothetical protein
MANCCYKRFCLLNPWFKCCFRYYKPITLEIIYFTSQLISVIFLIWGKVKFPWELYPEDKDKTYEYPINNNNKKYFTVERKYLKLLYNIGFIIEIITLAFFLTILILRLTKLINGVINIIIIIFCYIIHYGEGIGGTLLLISIIIIIDDFAKLHSDYKYINLFKEYPVVLWVFIVYGIFQTISHIPFLVDLQLIRFNTDLSYDEYKKQNRENEVKIKNTNETLGININNMIQGENPTTTNILENRNEIQNKTNIPKQMQNNINEQQNPQNKK